MTTSIPRVIHYCWFGGNPLPESARDCIASWHQYLPDYEIREWNESNFDVMCCDYVREAYEARKWAFVSDYARFLILYQEGGLYFDTDVELIRPINDIIDRGPFMGYEPLDPSSVIPGEAPENISTSFIWPIPGLVYGVNPGLGLGAAPGCELFREILALYQDRHYSASNPLTIVAYTTNILLRHGWTADGSVQTVAGIALYPPEYFCPLNYYTGALDCTDNTRSIHHYTASWMSPADRRYQHITSGLQNIFGIKLGHQLGRIVDFPHRVYSKIKQNGLLGTIRFILSR